MNNAALNKRAVELLENAKLLINKRNPITDINLFSILGMETKEVSAHSAFLFYVFKPFEINGEEDKYNLKVLYDFLRTEKPDLPENPANLNIFRETAFDNGRLDFFITYDNDAIVIELKIWAEEQEDQIERYREYLKGCGYSADNVFFLTPTGWKSTTGDSIPISLIELCDNVMKKIADHRQGDYQIILNQYISIVNKLGGIKEMDFIKDKSDIIAIQELYTEREKIVKSIKDNFYEELISEILSQHNNGIVKLKKSEIQGKKNDYEILFNIEDENKLISLYAKKQGIVPKCNNIKCLYSIKINEGRYPLFSGIVLKEDEKEYNHGIKDKVEEGGIHLFDSEYWMSWEYVTLNGNKINFNDFSNSYESVLNLVHESFKCNRMDIREIAKDLLRSFNDQYEILTKKLS